MPLLALEKLVPPEPRSGLRKMCAQYQTVPTHPMESARTRRRHARSKQTRYPATQRNNPLRKDDDDGPKDPNAMYWSTAPMDVLMLEDELDVRWPVVGSAPGTLIMLLGGVPTGTGCTDLGALHPRLPRCTCSWMPPPR